MSINEQNTSGYWSNRLIRWPDSAMRRLRQWRLSLLGVHIGRDARIGRVNVPRNPWDIWIGDNVTIEDGMVLLTTGGPKEFPRIKIGDRCYFNRNCMIDAIDAIEFGSQVLVGPFCYITDGEHTHDRTRSVQGQPMLFKRVKIESDVWIGAGVIILKGVTIGQGALIGAGAVVTRDVAPYAKVAGIPARQFGERK